MFATGFAWMWSWQAAQRKRIGELLGQIRDLELDLPADTGGRIVKALRISPQGDITEVELPNDHAGRFVEALRTLIAARTIEALVLTSRWDAWLDEDGYASAQPLNTCATALASHYGIPAPLRGTVVITGADRETGYAAALTPGQVTAIQQRAMNPSKTSP